MGVRATLTEITPQAFDEMMAGGNPDISGGMVCFLDKTWSEIHDLLHQAGYPLGQAIVGNMLHPDANHSYDEFIKGNHDYYIGFATVDLVKQIARALESVPVPDRFPDTSEITQWKENDKQLYIDYVGSYFRSLQAAYRDASLHGNALMVVIA